MRESAAGIWRAGDYLLDTGGLRGCIVATTCGRLAASVNIWTPTIVNILSIQSRVAFGHVGNSAAVFPLQRLGHTVWPVDTTGFSNHLGYGTWAGRVRPAAEVREVIDGLGWLGVLSTCDAVLSGYLGEALPNTYKILPPAPTPGTTRWEADRTVLLATRKFQDTPRWAMAQGDVDSALPNSRGAQLSRERACGLDARLQQVEHLALARRVRGAGARGAGTARDAGGVRGTGTGGALPAAPGRVARSAGLNGSGSRERLGATPTSPLFVTRVSINSSMLSNMEA